MHPIGRMVLGALALFIVWTVVRAWRTGVVYSEGWAFNLDDNPGIFACGVVVHIGIAAVFASLAAGYTPDELWQFVGSLSRRF